MRRIFLVLAVAALMGAMVAVTALPAFAASPPPNSNANPSCKGAFLSAVTPGQKDEAVEFLKEILGVDFGELRSCNPNANPQGGGPPSP